METERTIRNGLTYAVVILVFGVAVPVGKGIGFFDPVLLAAYACLGILFSGPAAAQAFEQQPASTAQALHWILKAALFGELLAVATLGCGVGTVYLTARSYVFPPDLELLAYALGLGLAGSLALAALAGWATIRLSPGAARMALRLVYLALLALFYFKGRWLPNVVETATVFSLLAAALFVMLLRMRLAIPAGDVKS
jgi:hypothetical protein